MRPNELYGMGKESITVTGQTDDVDSLLEILSKNFSIKFENNLEGIMGTEEFVEREDWNEYIGQPMFFLTDLKIEKVENE
jgi:hypothetical protein